MKRKAKNGGSLMKFKKRWTVTVDSKGRISIPAGVRRRFAIEYNTQFLLFVNDKDNLELRKWD